MKFYFDRFWISPYVFSTHTALLEKGLEFEAIPVGLDKKEQKTDQYRAISTTGRVPTVDFGNGLALAESSAIAEYLEGAYSGQGSRLFPEDLKERALARMLMAWLRSDFMGIREERSTETMFYKRDLKPLSDEAKGEARKLFEATRKLTGHGQKAHLFGNWSLADSELAFMLHRLILSDEPVPEDIEKYARDQWQRPSVQAFVKKTRDPYISYY